jgi:hypothetical protein
MLDVLQKYLNQANTELEAQSRKESDFENEISWKIGVSNRNFEGRRKITKEGFARQDEND